MFVTVLVFENATCYNFSQAQNSITNYIPVTFSAAFEETYMDNTQQLLVGK